MENLIVQLVGGSSFLISRVIFIQWREDLTAGASLKVQFVNDGGQIGERNFPGNIVEWFNLMR